MSALEHYGPPADRDEIARLAALMAQSFGFPPAEALGWFEAAGVDNLRALRRDGQMLAGLLLIPMGQFWGGRSVPMMGFAGVAAAPHARGSGVATTLMRAALREVRAAGFPLAALFPSTQTLYRGVGFEQAGARFLLTGPSSAFAMDERSLPVRPFAAQDLPEVQSLYAKFARNRQGWLDRGPYVWTRVQNPRGVDSFGYVVGAPGEVAGYVFYSLANLPKLGLRYELRISGWAASSVPAWHRLWTLLADHASVVDQVAWHGSSDDPICLLSREQSIEVSIRESWMLRVLDVEAAFGARGYNPHLHGELHLQVDDRSLPEASGRFMVRVEGGRATVSRGGRGELETDERALAALYAGQRSASELARLELIRAPQATLELADALLGGRPASLPDHF